MKIKEFDFDLEVQPDDTLFGMATSKHIELKLLDAINKDEQFITKDFENLEDLLTNDPERATILSYLIMRGWLFITQNSPLFTDPEEVEKVRNEFSGEDL